MCGLVGIVGHIDVKLEKTFKTMLCLDTVRGSDSTGVLSVKLTNQTHIAKEIGTPWDLMNYKSWDGIFSGCSKVLMGHNRSATKGKVSRRNAHPFEFDNVIGCHNGTLRITHNLKDHHLYDVDSEALFNHLDHHGIEHTLETVNGTFALTWYNKREDNFYIVRNSERPLSFAMVNNGTALIYASEAWMINVACGYNGVKLGEIVELPVATLLEIELPNNKNFSSLPDPIVIRDRKVEFYKTPATNITPFHTEKKKEATTTNTGEVVGGATSSKAQGNFVVRFEVVAHSRMLTNKSHYIEGTIIEADCSNDELITETVRLFPQYMSTLWNQLVYSPKYFMGEVKHYTSIEGGYYAIDLRTVVELEDEEVVEPTKCYNCGGRIDKDDKKQVAYPTGQVICGVCVDEFKAFALSK